MYALNVLDDPIRAGILLDVLRIISNNNNNDDEQSRLSADDEEQKTNPLSDSTHIYRS